MIEPLAIIGTTIVVAAALARSNNRQKKPPEEPRDVDLSIPDQSDYGWGRESSNQDRDG